MKNMRKMILTVATVAVVAVSAKAQEVKIAIEGQAYLIESTEDASVNGTFVYEWYRNNVPILECTEANCTVPANLCNGNNIVFRRKMVVTGGCAGDAEGYTNTVTVTFKCGGGHGTKLGSLCWADRNVGQAGAFTATAHEYSPFYQWNRNKAWSVNNETPDGWLGAGSITDNSWTVSPHPCPNGWRLPTQAELTALNNTGTTWVNAGAKGNAVMGRFYGSRHATCTFASSGNMSDCIFLPASGSLDYDEGTGNHGNFGYYWSSTNSDSNYGYSSYFGSGSSNVSTYEKTSAHSLRCVQ